MQDTYVVPQASYHNTALFIGGLVGFLIALSAISVFICRMRGTRRRYSTADMLPRPLILPIHSGADAHTSTPMQHTSSSGISHNLNSSLPSPVLPRDLVKQLCTHSPTSSVTLSSECSSPLYTPKFPESIQQLSPAPIPPSKQEKHESILKSGLKGLFSTSADARIPESYSFEFKCRGEGRFSASDPKEELMIITNAHTPEIQLPESEAYCESAFITPEVYDAIFNPPPSPQVLQDPLATSRVSWANPDALQSSLSSAPVLDERHLAHRTSNKPAPSAVPSIDRSKLKSPTQAPILPVPHHRDLTPAKSCLKTIVKPADADATSGTADNSTAGADCCVDATHQGPPASSEAVAGTIITSSQAIESQAHTVTALPVLSNANPDQPTSVNAVSAHMQSQTPEPASGALVLVKPAAKPFPLPLMAFSHIRAKSMPVQAALHMGGEKGLEGRTDARKHARQALSLHLNFA